MISLRLPRRLRGVAVAGSVAATVLSFSQGAYAANLINNGGPVETTPHIYLVWWGQQWATGWTDATVAPNLSVHTYTSAQAQTYITDFVKFAGGYGSVTQYGAGIPHYAGSWVDTNPLDTPPPVVPDNCVVLVCFVPGSSIDVANLMAQEAIRAQTHFLGAANDPNANYVILLPKATITVGVGVYCAYHSEAKDGAGRKLSWTNMPYLPDVNATFVEPLCGENWVNQTDNAYGNGYFDGYSIVVGHEIAEAATDPFPFTAPAWRDPSGQENGDLCAWGTPGTPGGAHNVGPDANGHIFAVQTYWSNSAGACV